MDARIILVILALLLGAIWYKASIDAQKPVHYSPAEPGTTQLYRATMKLAATQPTTQP